MVDCFALLNEPRRPWLDPESLKQKFFALSAGAHPDHRATGSESERRAAQEQYTQINSAYQCLRHEKDRLAHFLELERGVKPEQLSAVPPELMELSIEISRRCREADTLAAEKSKVSASLLKAKLFERSQLATDGLLAQQSRIVAWREQLLAKLRDLDQEWTRVAGGSDSDRRPVLGELEELYRLFGYVNRWIAQIQERIAQLSF